MEKEDLKTLETFREALAKITADRQVFTNMVEAYDRQDIGRLQEIVNKFDFHPPLCFFVCRTICWIEHTIRCAKVCEIICK